MISATNSVLFYFFLVAVLIPKFPVHGQTASFLNFHPQPQIHALGNATVALEAYQGAIGVNPASISESGVLRFGTNVSSDHLLASEWLPSTEYTRDWWVASPSVSMQIGRISGAARFTYFSRGKTEFEVRDSQGNRLGLARGEGFGKSITIAGAYEFTSNLTGGIAFRRIRQQKVLLSYRPGSGRSSNDFGEFTETTPAIDLGLHYDWTLGNEYVTVHPSFGWSLTNFGPNVDFPQLVGDEALPMRMRAGIAANMVSARTWQNRPFVRVLLSSALSKPLVSYSLKSNASGDTIRVADGPLRTLFNSGWTSRRGQVVEGDVTQLSVWEQVIKHVGVEVSLFDIFSLRLGRFHENPDAGPRQYTAYGFGVDLHFVALQHSWSRKDDTLRNSFWRLTARIPLSESPRNFWPALLRGED